jgi:uncharacterized membrane protein YgcG
MSNTIYTDAIAEAKLLKETAEQNAKNAIIEAVTPRIRSFIEDQLLGNSQVDKSYDNDILESVASDIVGESSIDEVMLDESALVSLLEVFGGKEISSLATESSVKDALHESFVSLGAAERQKLIQVANKLNQNIDLFTDDIIPNDVHIQQESSRMSANKDRLYEVDLDELAEMAAAMMAEEDHDKVELEETEGGPDVEPQDEDDKLDEIMSILGLGHLTEDKIEIDLGDAELPDDIQLAARLVLDDEDEEEVEVEDDIEIEDEEEIELPDEGGELEDLDEVFDIDPEMLRSEIRRLKIGISEAKELAKLKGIKNDMADSWGGKGSSGTGVKGAYGGSGTGKAGVDGSYGGGKASGDPLKVTLNKLSEAVKNERRKNRSLANRLSEYRSAVETLREQLTDLNLFNAKLLYVNKLLQNKDVSSSQRKTVVESIDNAKSLREVKLVYKTLTESFSKGNGGALRESATRRALGSSSRVAGRSSSDSAATEVNRWAVLAGINNNK